MKQVSYAISAYRDDHNEQCPALLDELYDHGIGPSNRAPARFASQSEAAGGLHFFQTDGEF